MPSQSMRSLSSAAFLALIATGAVAGEPTVEGPVTAGGFGMSGADYYGDLRSHMPFTRAAPPRPIGISDIERVRAARRRAEVASRQSRHRRHRPDS